MATKILLSLILVSLWLSGALLFQFFRYDYIVSGNWGLYVHDRWTGKTMHCLVDVCSLMEIEPENQFQDKSLKSKRAPNIFDQFDGRRVDRLEPVC